MPLAAVIIKSPEGPVDDSAEVTFIVSSGHINIFIWQANVPRGGPGMLRLNYIWTGNMGSDVAFVVETRLLHFFFYCSFISSLAAHDIKERGR